MIHKVQNMLETRTPIYPLDFIQLFVHHWLFQCDYSLFTHKSFLYKNNLRYQSLNNKLFSLITAHPQLMSAPHPSTGWATGSINLVLIDRSGGRVNNLPKIPPACYLTLSESHLSLALLTSTLILESPTFDRTHPLLQLIIDNYIFSFPWHHHCACFHYTSSNTCPNF